MPRHRVPRARSTRTSRFSVEALEGRQLMAELGLVSAAVRGDGRIVELVFSGDSDDPIRVPDWTAAAAKGNRLVTNGGLALEPLGTVVDDGIPQFPQGMSGGGLGLESSSTPLTWTCTFLVSDPSRVITFGADVTLTGGSRLFDDGANWTAALDAVAARNGSIVDADGFSTDRFERGKGGVTIYVSSEYGNDTLKKTVSKDPTVKYATDLARAQNPATPLKSLKQAFFLLKESGQGGKGAAIRLLRGDVFSGNVAITVDGQDREHPFVLEDYWHDYGDGRKDPGTRPILRSDMSKGENCGLVAQYEGKNDNGTLDYIVIRRLRLELVNRSDDDKAGIGIRAWKGGRDWVIDDCVVDEFRTGIAVDDINVHRFSDVLLLRTVVTDSHANAVGKNVKNAKSQGLFAKNVDGLLVSQSVFDRNGRVTSGGGRNIYSHNMYIQSDCGPATIWGSVIRAGGSHGVQLRPGGILAYNYLARNAIAGFIRGGVATRNVVEWSDNIGSQGRGFGLGIATEGHSTTAAVEFNFIVSTRGEQPRALFAEQTPTGSLLDGLIRNNTVVHAGYLFVQFAEAGLLHQIRVADNLGVSDAEKSLIVGRPGPWNTYSSDHNLWRANDPNRTFSIKGGLSTWSNWVKTTGTEGSSIRTDPGLVNDKASIAGHAGKVGGGATEDNFLNKIRSRKAGEWTPMGDAMAIYRYFASQYRPTTLKAVASGATDYYGAVDYR